ncbi:MGMT family protein [Klebsiella pneumoniae]|nr:MGMT family protein [Klebsiella pneumoniae]MCA6672988.1 MGMT family protein [Klebsiella pneumoniae]MDM9374718.1 MGMT family protein [Klebsiella pneumoniae]MDM9387608.1 MGMT family protein [Klebsiella pneumoniae]MDM9392231.1 MGMT family protein [Klebsiella pneumoniae]MDM9399597.1 MGMT family protein [Klebsiella pneumoniae]
MTDSSPQTITLPLPAIEGMTIAFQGVNYLRPEKMLDFATISPAPVRAVTPLALLYSTVGVLRQVGGVLKRLPKGSTLPWHRVVNRHGDISLTGPDLQRQRQALLAEGVQVSGSGHIDLQHYRWVY